MVSFCVEEASEDVLNAPFRERAHRAGGRTVVVTISTWALDLVDQIQRKPEYTELLVVHSSAFLMGRNNEHW